MKRWLGSLGWSALLCSVLAGEPHAVGAALIRVEDVESYVNSLASPALEGRDSPSRGLSLAARFLSQRLAELELDYTSDSLKSFKRERSAYRPWLEAEVGEAEGSTSTRKSGTYLRPWVRPFLVPVPKKCSLELSDPKREFEYGKDFVPVAGADGKARGDLVFAGYGIRSKADSYDDLDGLRLSGKIVLLFEGEPEHSTKFEGARVSEAASLWTKVATLVDEKVAGVLVVRKNPEAKEGELVLGPAFRFTQAQFNGDTSRDLPPREMPPILVISEACASELLGSDATALRKQIDDSVKPVVLELEDRSVSFRVKTELQEAALDNVVGILRGSDPKLANEYVVIGAHYDHIGSGPRARVGLGADDNASGTSGLLEVIEALVAAQPRRSILCVFFSGEEDGLLGSKAFCRDLPVDKRRIVAMVNLDMIGRGPTDKVAVLGLKQNPQLEELVERANALSATGVKEIEVCRDDSLFKRSDHYSFHSMLGVPTVFFLEDYPIENNPDYHTWRDTPDRVNLHKITNTAKLAYNTVWLLANEDGRPPRPKF